MVIRLCTGSSCPRESCYMGWCSNGS